MKSGRWKLHFHASYCVCSGWSFWTGGQNKFYLSPVKKLINLMNKIDNFEIFSMKTPSGTFVDKRLGAG